MKGWLYSREGKFALRTERFYYRLQWGFLSQHLTENSASFKKYYLHGSTISPAKPGFKVFVDLGPLGRAYGQEHPDRSTPRRLVLLADDAVAFQQWVTCLVRARDRKIDKWYTLQGELGQGSDAVVLLGVSKHNTNKKVAIKSIPLLPRRRERRREESRGVKLRMILKEIQLQHKGAGLSEYIPKIHDVFFDNDHCHIVMERCSRGSLSHLLEAQQGALPEPFVRRVVIQVGRSLLALHQANIAHRDVKCDNVLIRQTKPNPVRFLLADFGFASARSPDSEDTMLNFCHGMYGTEAYIAPEILSGERYGAPADIFSLGVLCYVCLVGVFPSMGRKELSGQLTETRGDLQSDLEKLARHPGIPYDAVTFCTALLNKDPRKRPTAAALLQHKWIRAGQIVTAQPRRRPSPGVKSGVVLRRVFHVISAVFALKKLLAERLSKTDSGET